MSYEIHIKTKSSSSHLHDQDSLTDKGAAEEEHAGNCSHSSDEIVEFAPPDAKYAWFIAAASFCNMASAIGIQNAFGVYQEYYLNDLYRDDSAVAISWISTLSTFCMCFGSIVTGKLTDKFGFRITCFAGAIMCGVALILASFAHTLWQLILAQGIMLGLGSALILSPSMSIVAQWHVKHRILATGIAVSGCGLGGMVLTGAAQIMMGNIGYRWSLRVLGLLVASVSGSMSLIYKRRVSASRNSNTKLLYSLCKDVRFLCISSAVTLVNMGGYEPTLYVPTAVAMGGGSRATSSDIVLMLNAGIAAGCILSSPLSAVLGPLTANMLSNIISFVLIFVFLQGVKTIAGYFVFSAMFGALSSIYLAINTDILAKEFGTHVIATSAGLSMACCGIGVLIGIPVQGTLYETYDRPLNRFTAVTAWAGACFALASVCYTALRIIVVRRTKVSFFSKV
ncbi:MFS general substrate transporter [Linderina pennispora]|uniref:MFS general substrate transporter n=1 Tax=Linderina pennispora TaxID=61395 RepID=A0A1Y1W9A2_9FUNG|nr:MFS general substrate transporter [Linderina pennispora]ORX70101.1 MFS general substrate transporter [Linderina pennispora]